MYIGCSTDIHLRGRNVYGFVTLGNHETINIFNESIGAEGYSSTFVDRSTIDANTTQVLLYYDVPTYNAQFKMSTKFMSWLDNGIIRTLNTRKSPVQQSSAYGSTYMKTLEYSDMKDAFVYNIRRLMTATTNSINAYVSSYNGILTFVLENPNSETQYTYEPWGKFIDQSGIYVEMVYRAAPLVDVTDENKNTVYCKLYDQPMLAFEVGTQAGTFSPWLRYGNIRKTPVRYPSLGHSKIEIAYFVTSTSYTIREYGNFYYDEANENIVTRQMKSKFMPVIQIYGNNIPTDFLCSQVKVDDVLIKTNNQAFIKQDGKLVPLKEMSGTTANRPTFVAPGSHYFDTTLGKPVYAKSVTSSGVVTWVDATGTAV